MHLGTRMTVRHSSPPKSICSPTLKYSNKNVAVVSPDRTKEVESSGGAIDVIPPLYIDTIAAGFGNNADLYTDVLRVPRDAPTIELRIAYFKRGREIMKEGGSSSSSVETGDLPELVRTRFQAVSMAYEILSHPAWKDIYLHHGLASLYAKAPLKSSVRFSDNVEERIFQPEPWEEEYSRMRKERRRKKILEELEADHMDGASMGSFWNDLVWEMGDFEQSLDGFLNFLPEKAIDEGGESVCESQEEPKPSRSSDSREARSMPTWLSPSSFQPVPSDPWGDGAPELDHDTSYASSFNPFTEDPPKREMQNSSPTSLSQELTGATQGFALSPAPQDLFTTPSTTRTKSLITRSPFIVGSTQRAPNFQTLLGKNTAPPSSLSELAKTTQIAKIYMYPNTCASGRLQHNNAWQSRVSVLPDRQNETNTHPQDGQEQQGRVTDMLAEAKPGSGQKICDQEKIEAEKKQLAKTYRNNDDIFDDLDDIWDNQKIHVSARLADGLSVISDLSESIVAKMMMEHDLSINPFDNSIVSDSPFEDDDSTVEESMATESKQQDISLEGQAGFAAKLAASVASMVADCQRTGTALQTLFGEEDRQVNEVIHAVGNEFAFPEVEELQTQRTSTMAEF